jgi:hypothetical protein
MRQVAMEEDRQAAVEGRAPLVISMVIRNDRRTQDERRYNSPAGEEIAVVFKNIDGATPENRDIRGHLLIPRRGKVFIRIDTQKPMCDPMTYPLLFPNGDNGWNQNLKRRNLNEDQDNVFHDHDEEQELLAEESKIADLNDEEDQMRTEIVPEPEFETEVDIDSDVPVPIYDVNRRGPRSRITQCEFYSSQLSIRKGIFNAVLYGGPLFQQYVVDAYVKVEANRIHYIQMHQKDLHVAQYNGLMDYITTRAERDNITVGTPVILPSSFIGSPRAMKQGYQDAMAICSRFGKPTYFLTFTCYPKWQEITESIESYEVAS